MEDMEVPNSLPTKLVDASVVAKLKSVGGITCAELEAERMDWELAIGVNDFGINGLAPADSSIAPPAAGIL